jgi:hypothetical protein
MRRDEPTRHGRAADALIASYVRELVAEDEPAPARADPLAAAAPNEALALPADGRAAQATR